MANKPAGCPTGYGEVLVESHIGVTAAEASCSCGTSVVTGRSCSASIVVYQEPSCGGQGSFEGSVASNSCLTTIGSGYTYRVGAPNLTAGSCTYPNATSTVPPPAFNKVELACGLTQAAACVSRPDCVATPDPGSEFQRMCIHTDGDVACPSEDYAVRFVAHKAIDDSRACSACSPTTPTGGTCGTNWGTRSTTTGCITYPPPSDKVAGTCYLYPGKNTIVDVGAMNPSAPSCTPTGGQPTGSVTSTEAVTFCCTN